MRPELKPINIRIVRFAFWLIRLRWYSILGVITVYSIAIYILHIKIWEKPVIHIVLFLILLNIISASFLKYLQRAHIRKSLRLIYRIINFQISTDLIMLTLLLHFSGGVENPFIIYYIFHIIISGIVLTMWESFYQTSFALVLVGLMTFLEYSGIIQHYPLEGLIHTDMYSNLTYLICTGLIFITTSYIVLSITRTIINESKSHEEAYIQAYMKLKKMDKIKDEYVMRITHDIKGHITAIQSCITVLNKKLTGPLNSQQEEFVNRAHNRIQALNRFITDLISITSRKLQHRSNKALFNLSELIDDVIKLTENSAISKNISIIKNVEISEIMIFGEKFSVEEVLSNLVMNAIKYSPSGQSVVINILEKHEMVLIEVIDKGIGIPENEINQVFNEFYRASNAKVHQIEGSGLGLAISKQIVDDHRGKIWVESKVDEGSKFSILLNKDK